MEEQQQMLDAQCKLMEDQKQALLGMQSLMVHLCLVYLVILRNYMNRKSEFPSETNIFGALISLQISFVFC